MQTTCGIFVQSGIKRDVLRTGTGLAEFVTDRSAELVTNTLVEALLFPLLGSMVVDETESVSVIVVPDATVEFTFTTKLKFAVALAARLAIVHMYGTVEVQAHPAGPVSDTKVVFAGKVSENCTVLAAAGPLLVTLCA